MCEKDLQKELDVARNALLKKMRPLTFYTLNENHEPIPESDVFAWAGWFLDNPDQSCVGTAFLEDGTYISTRFFGTEGCLWETIVFDKDHNILVQERYETYTDACNGHERTLRYYGVPS